MNIVLIGMSGSGKTTIGKQVACHTAKNFVDTDEEIRTQIGMSISAFFAENGEEAFRKYETDIVRSISVKTGMVIATGGGVITHPQNIDLLKQNGLILWLKRNCNLLETGNDRPLAPDFAAAKQLYQQRLPFYAAAADCVIENNESMEHAVNSILTAFASNIKTPS